MKSANTHFPSLSQEREVGLHTAKDEKEFDVNSMSLFIQRDLTGFWNLTCADVARHKSVSDIVTMALINLERWYSLLGI